jgi:very-short-patch-repair endonuclease
MLAACSGWFDLGKATRSIAFLDARSESPLESVSRAVLHERELPAPELQVEVVAREGSSYRVDFLWRAQGVVGEADGLQKYSDPKVLRLEKIRQERLEQLGLKVLRWNWREMLVDTDATMARIARALSR